MNWSKIKEASISKKYSPYFVTFFLGYLALNFFANDISSTYMLLFSTVSGKLSLIATIFVGIFVAMSLNLVIMKFKELRQLSGVGSFTALGIFGGLLGGACPVCFVGLFPAFLGLFGITASLADLPFYGLELQLGSIVLLGISITLLSKPTVCKTNIGKI